MQKRQKKYKVQILKPSQRKKLFIFLTIDRELYCPAIVQFIYSVKTSTFSGGIEMEH